MALGAGADEGRPLGTLIALAGVAGTVVGVFVLYFFLWGGFIIGSLVLGVMLVGAGVRLLFGWRPRPPRNQAVRVVVGLSSASLFGVAYGAAMWFGFPPDDASRGITAIPPLLFGALAMVSAASVAVASWVAMRIDASDLPEELHPA
jgi:hypothetical protein